MKDVGFAQQTRLMMLINFIYVFFLLQFFVLLDTTSTDWAAKLAGDRTHE